MSKTRSQELRQAAQIVWYNPDKILYTKAQAIEDLRSGDKVLYRSGRQNKTDFVQLVTKDQLQQLNNKKLPAKTRKSIHNDIFKHSTVTNLDPKELKEIQKEARLATQRDWGVTPKLKI